MIVTAQRSEACGPSVGAHAVHCVVDKSSLYGLKNRPLAGYINFCPRTGEITSQTSLEALVDTAVHEIIHTLFMSNPLFGTYIDGSGETAPCAPFARVCAEVRCMHGHACAAAASARCIVHDCCGFFTSVRTSVRLVASPIEIMYYDIYRLFVILDIFVRTALWSSCSQPSRKPAPLVLKRPILLPLLGTRNSVRSSRIHTQGVLRKELQADGRVATVKCLPIAL
jgi:hypothetical protein